MTERVAQSTKSRNRLIRQVGAVAEFEGICEMIAHIIILCRHPKRTEPEKIDHYWLLRRQTATTYAQRQIADTLMRVPKIKTSL